MKVTKILLESYKMNMKKMNEGSEFMAYIK